MRNVHQIGSCKYIEVNDQGLVIETNGNKKTLEVDTVVVCAGQVSEKSLYTPLTKNNSQKVFLIGGSEAAGELDAKRAIDQGTRLAAVIEDAKTGDVFNAPIGFGFKAKKMYENFFNKK